MIMTIEISDKYPLPERKRKKSTGRVGDGRQEAISKLEVGSSFWLPTTMSSMGTLRWWAVARYPEREFVLQPEGSGVRIWRSK
jgi:hypothetical protein